MTRGEIPVIRRGRFAADQFTTLSNTIARDGRLSYRAKGLFLFLASQREGRDMPFAQIMAHGTEGRDAVRKTLNELEKFGYLAREKGRDAAGRLGPAVYLLTDLPDLDLDDRALGTDDFRALNTGQENAGLPSPENRPGEKTIRIEKTKKGSAGAEPTTSRATASKSDLHSLQQRANLVARGFCDRYPLSNFHGVRGVVDKALRAGIPEDRLVGALAALGDAGTPVTVGSLQFELKGRSWGPQGPQVPEVEYQGDDLFVPSGIGDPPSGEYLAWKAGKRS